MRAPPNNPWLARRASVITLVATALVLSVSFAGCLGPSYTPSGTATWSSIESGAFEFGQQLYHYRTVYFPEPDTLDPQEDGFEVVFRDVRFYFMLGLCLAGEVGSCLLRVAIFVLDLIYDDEIEPPQGLAPGEGQVYLGEGGAAGLLWQGREAIRLLVAQ